MNMVASIENIIDGPPHLEDGSQVSPSRGRRLGWIVKLTADKTLALFLLLLLLPALLLLVILVMSGDFGSPFFAHERVGRGGKPFRCFKLRSMRKNSAAMLEELLASDPERAREWETHGKLRNDPRIIPFGRFIRATSLDELPQLFNILRGDMSFVGPRPVTLSELVRYDAHAAHYLAVPPGLTGLWQVSGRSDIGYAERIALDVSYVETWALWRDLKILLRTPRAVFAMAGAC